MTRLLYICFLWIFSLNAEPVAVYLTWQHAPNSTMAVHWIAPANKERITFHAKGDPNWYYGDASHVTMPFKLEDTLYAVELRELKGDQVYEFNVDGSLHSFKTAPDALKAPLSFIVGGDIYHDSIDAVKAMNRVAAQQNPLFAVVGGISLMPGRR